MGLGMSRRLGTDCCVPNPNRILPSVENTPSLRVPIRCIARVGQITGHCSQIGVCIPAKVVSGPVTPTYTNAYVTVSAVD